MKSLMILLPALFLSYSAQAKNDHAKYTELTSQASISLVQALEKAEQHVSGKAVNAEIDRHLGKVVYEVEVLTAAKVFEVFVDAKDGSVLEAREDLD